MTATSELAFRFAGAFDAPAIASLIESAYRGEDSKRGWTTEAHLIEGNRTNAAEIASLIVDPKSRFVLAFDNTALVGCALIKNDNGLGYFGMFAVSPTLQGAGHGKKILSHAEQAIRQLWSCPTVAMTVISIREDLIAYYERRGYKRTGTKPFPFENEPGARRKDFHFVVLTKAWERTHPAGPG
ncbi:MAG: GNAT family N-acetyltransferase [Alphaproteobacteria bacterium]|nr:GNAT family N-acetyltransferase [Alphaproteobacteria bacterium]